MYCKNAKMPIISFKLNFLRNFFFPISTSLFLLSLLPYNNILQQSTLYCILQSMFMLHTPLLASWPIFLTSWLLSAKLTNCRDEFWFFLVFLLAFLSAFLRDNFSFQWQYSNCGPSLHSLPRWPLDHGSTLIRLKLFVA